MRIGFACILLDQSGDKVFHKEHNFRSTTIRWLRENPLNQREKMLSIVQHNVSALNRALHVVASWPELYRMMRIGSSFLPAYTHRDFKWFKDDPEVRNFLETNLLPLGNFAKEHRIRLSMHPGQYTVLNSVNGDTVLASIEEIEYHADIAQMLGYTDWHEGGFAINIHVGSKAGGIESFRRNAKLLSPIARNLLTVENDEICFGLDDVLQLSNEFPVVLDIHHEWCFTEGHFIQPSDPRILQVIESWRGIRPKIHYSLSREEYISSTGLPDYSSLQYPKSKLRAHSDMCHNPDMNAWALSHSHWADIMVEAKAKNLAARQLFIEHK